MSDELNISRFIKTLNIAISADIGFEGDAQDAKEILDYFNALLARADRAERMVERLIEACSPMAEYYLVLRHGMPTESKCVLQFEALVAEWQARNE